MTAQKIFNNFRGSWLVNRDFEGRLNGRAKGVAKFEFGGDQALNYHEDLTVTFITGASYNARREYIYTCNEQTISKWIDKTNYFDFNFNASGNEACGIYNCSNDTYRATYNFINDDHFTLKYHVQGPTKNYVINSQYFRPCLRL